MKWFKHDTMAAYDAKIKRLRIRFGLEGVGLYWTLLESIARGVSPHNLSFELEEDSELIATELGLSHEKVEIMMKAMVELGLFENVDGTITCLKLRERSDEYTQKLLRNSNSVRTISGVSPEKVPPIRREENRTEEKKIGAKAPPRKRFKPPTREEVEAYMLDKGASPSVALTESQKLIDHYGANGWVQGSGATIKSWKHCVSGWLSRRDKFNGKNEVSFI